MYISIILSSFQVVLQSDCRVGGTCTTTCFAVTRRACPSGEANEANESRTLVRCASAVRWCAGWGRLRMCRCGGQRLRSCLIVVVCRCRCWSRTTWVREVTKEPLVVTRSAALVAVHGSSMRALFVFSARTASAALYRRHCIVGTVSSPSGSNSWQQGDKGVCDGRV